MLSAETHRGNREASGEESYGRFLSNYFRYYDPSIGRYISADPIGQIASGDPNLYAYVWNDPVNWVDLFGLSGFLTIHSSGNGGSSMMSGHSWVSFNKDGGTTTTYGTWGNDPGGLGNGLHENLEAGRTGDASRTIHIDDAAEAAFMATVGDYKARGEDAWTLDGPCSSFARDAWESGTGEDLNSNYGPISNPTTLKNSIIRANGGTAHSTATTVYTSPCFIWVDRALIRKFIA